MDEYVRLGMKNQQTLELARRHCLRMEFVESGGRGMLEGATGLPINMRQVRCPVALGNMAMNLHWIASDFVREHCGGCSQRNSTGEVPNLATVVAEEDAAAERAEAEEATKLDAVRAVHADRADARRVMSVGSDVTMGGALQDLATLDVEPGVEVDSQEQEAALARLNALADKAPETFTQGFVDHAVELVAAADGATQVLEPLRRLSLHRSEFAEATVQAALNQLRRRPAVSAGRCLADLVAHVPAEDVDAEVCRSVVMLAGAVSKNRFGGPKQAHDPTALRVVADLAPEQLAQVVNDMLAVTGTSSGLILIAPGPALDPELDYNAAAAAGAARALAATHVPVAEQLTAALVRQLTVRPDGLLHDDVASPTVQRALSAFVVLGVGDVLDKLREAGSGYRGRVGERLVRVLSLAADLTFGESRWREPGDPTPNADRQDELAEVLFGEALARIGGDWGDEARSSAAELAKDIAEDRPQHAFERLPAILGAFLDVLEEARKTAHSPLEVVAQTTSPQMQALERLNRDTMFGSAAYRTLEVVETLSEAAPAAACRAVVGLIDEERDTDRGSDAAWYLLKFLGRIGQRHGDQSKVLQTLLPTLHTYMVGADPALQFEALDAWTSIGSSHPLPSSVGDLLPALIADNRVGIARAVARAAVRLEWTPEQMATLLVAALQLLNGVDPSEQTDAVKESVRAIKVLARKLDNDDLRERVEKAILERVDPLNGYALRDVLDRTGDWMMRSSSSPRMARLRLRQAADPQINDRWNASDDEELCDLLATGAGLLDLPAADLKTAGLILGPDHPFASAEFAEVAWRAGRVGTAVELLDAFLTATPDQPSHKIQRQILEVIRASAAVDAAVADGHDWEPRADGAVALTNELATGHDKNYTTALAASVAASVAARRALRDAGHISGNDPASRLEDQATALDAAGIALDDASQRATPTGRYLRAFAAACQAAAHLVRSEAAALQANTESRDAHAHAHAAARRAELLRNELADHFQPDDPLAGPLGEQLERATAWTPGAETATLLDNLATLLLPLPIVTGPRARSFPGTGKASGYSSATEASGTPVAVVLASLDGDLITGPQVLRGGRVYELSVRVQTDEWPEWAERMDLEFLSHLTPAEMSIPGFTWQKSEHTGDQETYEQSGSIALRFSLAAGQPGIPLMTNLTWRGTKDGRPVNQRIDVSGHRGLRMRPYDETRDRATDYPVFDERLLGLYDMLAAAGYDEDQLQAFCRLLTSICRAGLAMTWDKKYRRGSKVTERAFHDDLHNRLVADPELGGRVERASPLALGFLDVRHDGITAELKVERRVPVTRERAPKYAGQPTQYAAGDGARLSILTILDMSPKLLPIGTPENYLFPLEPKMHGMTNPEAPSLVAVLIVNGNMPTPSSWSRKKTPIADPDDEA